MQEILSVSNQYSVNTQHDLPMTISFNTTNETLTLNLNIAHFKQFHSLTQLIDEMKEKPNYYQNLFYIPKNFGQVNFKQEQENFNAFLQFANEYKDFEKLDLDIIHNDSSIPLLTSGLLPQIKNKSDEKEQLYSIFKYFLKHFKSYFNLMDKMDNIDSLYAFLYLCEFYYEKDNSNNHNRFLFNIFSKSFFANMMEGVNTLLKLTDKTLKDYPLIQHTINKFFEFEIYLLKSKNRIYLNYLNKHQQAFSDLFSYYSIEQKKTINQFCFTSLQLDLDIDLYSVTPVTI